MPVADSDIAQQARSIFPVTWDALLSMSDDQGNNTGEGLLEKRLAFVKELIFGENIDMDDEATQYPLLVRNYAAKHLVIDLINPAIDYYLNQPIGVATTGTSESSTYEERIDHLRKLKASLLADVIAMKPDIEDLLDYKRPANLGVPGIRAEEALLTPNPWLLPPPYQT